MKNAFKSAKEVKPKVINMTATHMGRNYELVFQRWDRHLPLDANLQILKDYFDVNSLDKVPFWNLYKLVKKLNSL